MDTLQRQIRRARRRLMFQRFLDKLGWCWFAALAAAAVLIAVDKFRPLGVEAWAWAAGALAAGLIAATVWTLLVRGNSLEAAIEIDHRFGLKERVSSALALSPADRQTEAGEALVADAVRRVERIDVAGRFAVNPPRRLLLPLLPGLLAALVALLVSSAGANKPAAADVPDPAAKQQIKKSTEVVRRQLAERREQAKKEGLQDAEKLFKKLEEGTKELNAESGKEKALVKLNDLSRMLTQRRQQLGGAEKVKEQLDQLKNIDRGPADKFAQAVSKGDFQKAADELKKLQAELANSKLDEKQKADLAKQLDQMKEKLGKLADAHKAAQEDLKQRAKQLRQAGQTAEANKLEEQLQKLAEQAPQMQQMKQMANQLGQCAKCLQQGQAGQCAKGLGQMQQQMKDMQKQLDEMGMLDDAMQQLAQARERMACKKCGGAGCGECQGPPDGPPGDGLGTGKGKGARPEKKTDTRSYDSQVKQKVGQGSAAVVDMVNGPNVKGDVRQQIQDQVKSATSRGATDPLTGRRMPRKHGEHTKEYFDGLRGD
jgi:hypothetical protein